MRSLFLLLTICALSTACSDVRILGAAAIEKKRALNDIKARGTMAAACDISVGAYFRELNQSEQNFVAQVCGGVPFDTSLSSIGAFNGFENHFATGEDLIGTIPASWWIDALVQSAKRRGGQGLSVVNPGEDIIENTHSLMISQ